MPLASHRWVNRRLEEVHGPSRPRRMDWGGSGGLDLSSVALGYEINPDGDDPDEVEIKAGEIDRVAVTATKLVVADDDYVYVRRTIADDTMLVTNGSSVPANDDTYRYYRLYRFTVTDERASIQNIYRPFDIDERASDVDIPAPPETGTYVLLSTDGVLSWIEVEACS